MSQTKEPGHGLAVIPPGLEPTKYGPFGDFLCYRLPGGGFLVGTFHRLLYTSSDTEVNHMVGLYLASEAQAARGETAAEGQASWQTGRERSEEMSR